jgi:hypothetical protein
MHKEISILRKTVSCYPTVYRRGGITIESEEESHRRLLVVSYLSHRDDPEYYNGRIHLSDTDSKGEYKNDRFIRLKEYVKS